MNTDKPFSIVSENEMEKKLTQIDADQTQQNNKKSLEKKSVFRELALGLLIGTGVSTWTVYVAQSDLIHNTQQWSSSEQKDSSDVLKIDKMIQDRMVDVEIIQMQQAEITKLRAKIIRLENKTKMQESHSQQFNEPKNEKVFPKIPNDMIPNEADMLPTEEDKEAI